MCGITGIIGDGDIEVLKKMTSMLKHRGPDDHGVKWFGNKGSGIGHCRLSIIDLSAAGHQPMTNADGSLWITYNGEIYNYRVIRDELVSNGFSFNSNSDTEVVLKAYELWGEDCLKKFNGMFAFAIFNCESGALFAARDRQGIKPFYFFCDNKRLIFSSEIKAILASGLVPKQPDYYALQTPTRFQISPLTGFEKIYKLEAGHYLVYQNGVLKKSKYWDIYPLIDNSITEKRAVEQLDELLDNSVKLQMIADVPVGVFLSGGLDSSIITAFMKQNTTKDLHAFTIRFSSEDQKFEKIVDDSYYAKKVAEKFDLKYHELEVKPDIETVLPKMIWHLDEPLADPAAINTWMISKSARDLGIIVLLNGMGGDEIFGGYRKHLACLLAEEYQKIIPSSLQKSIHRILDILPVASSKEGFRLIRWIKRFLSFASLPKVERFLSSDLSLSPDQYSNLFKDCNYHSSYFYNIQKDRFLSNKLPYLTQMCLNDTKVMLNEHNLLYSDKASMAASIETRPPLIDHNIIEFMFSLPHRYLIKGNIQKFLLKKVSERYLPSEIIYRPKAPFGSPLRSWIRGPLATMVDDLLSENSIKKRGIYNNEFVSRLIRDDRIGKEDNAHIIWTLLTNELWFQIFFD